MKIFRCVCLIMAATFCLTELKAQGTTPNTPPGINPSTVTTLIQSNADKLQMMGINPTDAQNMANQMLQNGGLNQTQQVNAQTTSQNNNPAPNNNPPANNNPNDHSAVNNNPQPNTAGNDGPKPDELPHATIFGQSFFRDKNIPTFSKATDMQAPDNYILGIGDKLTVNIWGYSSFSSTFTVDETGAILPTQTGKIYLKGMTFGKAKKLIRSRFGTMLDMSNSEMDVALNYSRVISVNIVGEVFYPGSYTMPAINTAFNALMAASGPTNIGSLRKIYIKRGGQTVQTLDVYEFLLNPNSKQDYYMQDNDYIFIPPNEKVVDISGEVLRPNSFELLPDENLNTILKYAGGLSPKAFLNNVVIQRYEGVETKLISLNLDSLLKGGKDFILKNGDRITINSISELIINQIKVNGPVTAPGTYSFKNGDRISEILSKNPLRNDALTDKAYIIRTRDDFSKQYISFSPEIVLANPNSSDNMKLKNEDVITFFSKSNFNDNLNISINGSVRNPGEYQYGRGMSLKDALYFAGGLKPEAASDRIEISRVLEKDAENQINPIAVIVKSITVNKDLSIDDESASFELQPNDQVIIRESNDLNKPGTISISGEVQYPGNYVMLDKLERWTAVIKRAGGLSKSAYPEDAYLIRKDIGRGIVLTHLDRAMKETRGKYDYILKDGDQIVIPKRTNVVKLSGLIRYPDIETLGEIDVPLHEGKRAKYYIKHYGLGFEKKSRRARTYVVNPGQNVSDCHKFFLFNIYPKVSSGAMVVVTTVPAKELLPKKERSPLDWNRAISTLTVSLTGVATIYILLNKL